jgi:hypothetical protein
MSGPGYVFKDSGITPPAIDAQPIQIEPQSTAQVTSQTSQDHPEKGENQEVVVEMTKIINKHFPASSQELAKDVAMAGGAGAVQKRPISKKDVGIRDVGWHKPIAEIPDPLLFDIPNGRLWSMIRRFNKVRLSFYTDPPLTLLTTSTNAYNNPNPRMSFTLETSLLKWHTVLI